MSFDRAGKTLANERKYPFIVEVPVAAKGLKVELSRQIVDFHKSRGIAPQLGRTAFRDGKSYYRWCFSELETARALSNSLVERSTKQRTDKNCSSTDARSPLPRTLVCRSTAELLRRTRLQRSANRIHLL